MLMCLGDDVADSNELLIAATANGVPVSVL